METTLPTNDAPRLRAPLAGMVRGEACRPGRRPGRSRQASAARAGISERVLQRETRQFRGSGGISEENRGFGFRPAFYDSATRIAYLSRFANGDPAPCHILDGLPDELVVARNARGGVAAVRPSLVSGFLLQGRFYSRDEAARKLAELG